MGPETITIQEDTNCAQCGADLVKGQSVEKDKLAGTVFCTEFHWAAYYDVDGAAAVYKKHHQESDDTE